MPETVSDKESSVVRIIEAHEDFIQHIEKGSSIIRGLSIITIAVAALLFASYSYQLILPYLTGTGTVTVSLVDPFLQSTEIVVAVLTLLWLYVGIKDYLFTRRMSKAIREARALEKEIEKRIAG